MPSPMTKAGVPLTRESIGEDGVPRDQRIHGLVLHVAHKPFGIEADGAGNAQDVIEVEGASAPSSAR